VSISRSGLKNMTTFRGAVARMTLRVTSTICCVDACIRNHPDFVKRIFEALHLPPVSATVICDDSHYICLGCRHDRDRIGRDNRTAK
jgi:hypothetical protein